MDFVKHVSIVLNDTERETLCFISNGMKKGKSMTLDMINISQDNKKIG